MCATCQKKLAVDAAVTRADGLASASSVIRCSTGPFQGFGSISSREMSETGRTVPDMNEPLSRYDVTVTVACDGGSGPDLAAFAAARSPAWQVGEHQRAPVDRIISVVTVTAPDRYAAVAVARAVVSDGLNRQALSPATQQTTVPSIVPTPRPDRKQPSAYWLFRLVGTT